MALMSPQLMTIRMIKNADSVPWGFRIQGGSDFSIPLSIQKVNPGSVADKSGLLPGDQVCKISSNNSDLLSHKQAQETILASRNDLELTVQRGGMRIWKPQVMIKDSTTGQNTVKHSLQQKPDHSFSNGTIKNIPNGTATAHYNGSQGLTSSFPSPPTSKICQQQRQQRPFQASDGSTLSSHQQPQQFVPKLFNAAPKPFGFTKCLNSPSSVTVNGLSSPLATPPKPHTIAAKVIPAAPPAPKEGSAVKAVYHSQYNSPINMYSSDNVVDAFEGQTKGKIIAAELESLKLNKLEKSPPIQESATYKFLQQNQPFLKAKSPALQPIQSGSFKRIEDSLSDQSNSDTGVAKIAAKFEQARPFYDTAPITKAMDFSPPAAVNALYECFECSRPIIGVFVKINDSQFLHPECFKCSTCGTSLKNKGHFYIQQKLYCDIHARTFQSQNVNNNFPAYDQNVGPSESTTKRIISPPSNVNYSQNIRNDPYESASSRQGNSVYNTSNPPLPQLTPTSPNMNSSNRSGGNPAWRPPTNGINPSNYYSTIDNPPLLNIGSDSAQFNMMHVKPGDPGVGKGQYSNEPGVIGAANAGLGGGSAESNKTMMRRGHGIYNESLIPGVKIPICEHCHNYIRGPYISALNKTWCPSHFLCSNPSCGTPLQTTGFVEEKGKIYCEICYEKYFAPRCSKCGGPILGDCLNALDRPWHPECFSCAQCHKPFGNSTFYMENGQPYCERDWNNLFTIRCDGCHQPIRANERWVEALNKSYHSNCFVCTVCHKPLEGQSFFAKDGLPFCKMHAAR